MEIRCWQNLVTTKPELTSSGSYSLEEVELIYLTTWTSEGGVNDSGREQWRKGGDRELVVMRSYLGSDGFSTFLIPNHNCHVTFVSMQSQQESHIGMNI